MQLNRLRYVDPKSSQFPKGRTSKGLICILATGKRNYGTQLFHRKKKLQDTIPLCLSLFLAFWISPLFSSRQKQIMFSRIICLTKIINLRRKSQEKKNYNSSVINNMTLRLCIVAHSIFVNPDVLFLNNLIITIIRKKDLTFEALSYFSNKKESIYITKL